MSNNIWVEILCSVPVILIALYFVPFLGMCLILFRLYMKSTSEYYRVAASLVVLGIIFIIPQVIHFFSNIFNYSTANIPYYENILSSEEYPSVLKYGKVLISVGVSTFILSAIFRRTGSKIRSFFREQEKINREISEKNDLKIKEKQEKAKNTHFVKCPHCGGDNTIVGSHGCCKYCRQSLEYKE